MYKRNAELVKEDNKVVEIERLKMTNRLAEALALITNLGENFKKEQDKWEKMYMHK